MTACDLVPGAVDLARRNAQQLAISNVTIVQSDWFAALSGEQFALITSNPPYIDAQDPHLSRGDVRFEPLSALVAADHGLSDLAVLIADARAHLLPGGWLLLEHGWQQGASVRKLFSESGYQQVETCRDYGGNERITLGQYLADM